MSNIDKYPERKNVPGSKLEVSRDESSHSSVRARLTDAARQVPQGAEDALERSRNSRLATEAKNAERNPIHRFFGSGSVGWIARTIVQAIPFPFTIYGPGDIITGISAGFGRDILTGDHLDAVDRFLYLGASLIPGVPATIIVDPARLIRRNVEDAMHAKKKNQKDKAVMHTKDALIAARAVIKGARKK